MGIIIKGNLFYIQSKEMSMIIENREGDLLLRHIGGKIANYHGSNAILEKDHAFQAIRLLIIVRLAMIPNVRFSGYMVLVIFVAHHLKSNMITMN